MMGSLVLLLPALQGTAWTATPAVPTVGDTVVLERVVPAAPGARARTGALDAGERLEPLAEPRIDATGQGVRVRHVVALFAPGEHRLPMPAIELLHPDGTVEVVAGDTAVVWLEPVVPDSLAVAEPMPSRAPLARPARRPGRAVAPVGVVLALLGGWLLWRRRARTDVEPLPEGEPVPEMPLMRWLALGERRAVATIAVRRLREAVAAEVPETRGVSEPGAWAAVVRTARPAWPTTDLTDILRALERARFAPLGADDLAELIDRADVVRTRLHEPKGEA